MKSIRAKIMPAAKLSVRLSLLKRRGKRVVFTNGVYDLLHAGHVALLAKARALGDVLVLGLNTDASVKRLKGSKRPVMKAADRGLVAASLEPVDFVVFFGEDTPCELIKKLRPEVLVKGGDYAADEIVGGDLVKKVVRIPLLKGRSTTNLIARIRRAYGRG